MTNRSQRVINFTDKFSEIGMGDVQPIQDGCGFLRRRSHAAATELGIVWVRRSYKHGAPNGASARV